MRTRAILIVVPMAVGIAVVLAAGSGGTGACGAGSGSSQCVPTAPPVAQTFQSGLVVSTPSATAVAGPTATPAPPTPEIAYTFQDEFDGTRLNPAWGTHWPGFGSTVWADSQVSLADGLLTIRARRSGTQWVSGLLDTVGTFTQAYGTFTARMRFDEGSGLWPAFWLAQPQNPAHEDAEIDVMEVCANNPGDHDLNDVTLLHSYVHRTDGSHAYATGYRTSNLADAWHVYSIDWRPGLMTFSFDGVATSQFTSDPNDPRVPKMAMAVVLDLGVGGRFCGDFDSTTPAAPELQVDWVRVTALP